MMEEELNIHGYLEKDVYEDINDFDLGDEFEKLKTENAMLKKHIDSLQMDIEKLMSTIKDLKLNEDNLKKNISTLFATAKSDIQRKDNMISDLRLKLDDIYFRRSNINMENKRKAQNFNSLEENGNKKYKGDGVVDSQDEIETYTNNSKKRSEKLIIGDSSGSNSCIYKEEMQSRNRSDKCTINLDVPYSENYTNDEFHRERSSSSRSKSVSHRDSNSRDKHGRYTVQPYSEQTWKNDEDNFYIGNKNITDRSHLESLNESNKDEKRKHKERTTFTERQGYKMIQDDDRERRKKEDQDSQCEYGRYSQEERNIDSLKNSELKIAKKRKKSIQKMDSSEIIDTSNENIKIKPQRKKLKIVSLAEENLRRKRMLVGKNANTSSTEQQHKVFDLTLDDSSRNSFNNDNLSKEFKVKSEKKEEKIKNVSKGQIEISNKNDEDTDDIFIIVDDISESEIVEPINTSLVIPEGRREACDSTKEFQNKMKNSKQLSQHMEVINVRDPSFQTSSPKEEKMKVNKHFKKPKIENRSTNEKITEQQLESTKNTGEETTIHNKINFTNKSTHNEECTNVAMKNVASFQTSSPKEEKMKVNKHLKKPKIENRSTNEKITEQLLESTKNTGEETTTNNKINFTNKSTHNEECTNVPMKNVASFLTSSPKEEKMRVHLKKSKIENHSTNEKITAQLLENTKNTGEEITTNNKFNFTKKSTHNEECTKVAMKNVAKQKAEIHLEREVHSADTDSTQNIVQNTKNDFTKTHKAKNEEFIEVAVDNLKQETVQKKATNESDSNVEVVIQDTKIEQSKKEEKNVLANSKTEKLKNNKTTSELSTEEINTIPLDYTKENMGLNQDVAKSIETSKVEKLDNLSISQVILDLSNKKEGSHQYKEIPSNKIEKGDPKNIETMKADTLLSENPKPEIISNKYGDDVAVTEKANIVNQELSAVEEPRKETKETVTTDSRSIVINPSNIETEESAKCEHINKNSTKDDTSNLVELEREECMNKVQSLTLSGKEHKKEKTTDCKKVKSKHFVDDPKKQDKINIKLTSNQNVENSLKPQNITECENKTKMDMPKEENAENMIDSTVENNQQVSTFKKDTRENKSVTNNSESKECNKIKNDDSKLDSAKSIQTLTVLEKDHKEKEIAIINKSKEPVPEDVKMQEKSEIELTLNVKNLVKQQITGYEDNIEIELSTNENVESTTNYTAGKMENLAMQIKARTEKDSRKKVEHCQKTSANKSLDEEITTTDNSEIKDKKLEKGSKNQNEKNLNDKIISEANYTQDTEREDNDFPKPTPSVKKLSVKESIKEKSKARTSDLSSIITESLKTSQKKHKEISDTEHKISAKLNMDSMKLMKRSCKLLIESEIRHCSVIIEEMPKYCLNVEKSVIDKNQVKGFTESKKNETSTTTKTKIDGTSRKDVDISNKGTSFIQSIGEVSKQILKGHTSTNFGKDSSPETNMNIQECEEKICKVSQTDNAENKKEVKNIAMENSHVNKEYTNFIHNESDSKKNDRKKDDFKNKHTNEKKLIVTINNENKNNNYFSNKQVDFEKELIRASTEINLKKKECRSANTVKTIDSKVERIKNKTNDNKKNEKDPRVSNNNNRDSTSVSKRDSKADSIKNDTSHNKEKNEEDPRVLNNHNKKSTPGSKKDSKADSIKDNEDNKKKSEKHSRVSHSHNKNNTSVNKKDSEEDGIKNKTNKNKKKNERDSRVSIKNNINHTSASKTENTPTENSVAINYPEQVKLDKACTMEEKISISKDDNCLKIIKQNSTNNKAVDADVNIVIKDEKHILDQKIECHKENIMNLKESGDSNEAENVETNIMKYNDMKNILHQNMKGNSTGICMSNMIKQSKFNEMEPKTCLINNPRKKIEIKSIIIVENSQKGSIKKDLIEELNSDTSTSDDTTVISKNSISKVVTKKLDDLIKKLTESNAEKISGSPKNKTVEESNKLKENNKSEQTSPKRSKRKRSNSEIRKSKAQKKDIVLKEVTPEKVRKELHDTINNENMKSKITENIDKNPVYVHGSCTVGDNSKTPEASNNKIKVKRRITPIPVKDNIPVCTFQNILEKNQTTLSQNLNTIQSPLHLTHDGEIPVLHLEENHINNLPTECNINDKNIMTLLDTMNISNMDCDMSKFKSIDNEILGNLEANVNENNLNVSPIMRNNDLTFKNMIHKVTSTPLCKTSEETKVERDFSNTKTIGSVDNLSVEHSVNHSTQTDLYRTTSVIRRKRRRVRMIMVD